MHQVYEARVLDVPEAGRGMRLDRFLSLRFADLSRSLVAKRIAEGLVQDPTGKVLRKGHVVQTGELLHLYLPEVAPQSAPPPFPEIVHEDDRVLVVDKPAGMMSHPGGTAFVWALISLAKRQYPHHAIDLVHRLDRDTSGLLAITKDVAANQCLKAAVFGHKATKLYQAIVKGEIPWETHRCEAPLGDANGIIRVQQAVVSDGKSATTEFTVLERRQGLTRVQCRLLTGRTHQIRVHLAYLGFPILGDRLYGVPPEVFLHTQDHGVDAHVLAQTGAPRHALHAWKLSVPHPDGHWLHLERPLPPDMLAWWADPAALPWDRAPVTPVPER